MEGAMDRTNPPTLLDLPRELLHTIVTECNPFDIAAIRAACRSLKGTVDNDKLVFKDSYLEHYDPPPIESSWNDASSWETYLKDFTRLQKLLDTRSLAQKETALRDAERWLDSFIKASRASDSPFQTSSQNLSILNRAFKDARNREAFLARSSLFAWAQKLPQPHYVDEKTSQASAKLHVYYGAPLKSSGVPSQLRMDTFARSRVYDLRRYTTGTFWGPFFDDGTSRVDWEKLQAIMLVVQHNLHQFHMRTSKRFPLLWHAPWAGIAPKSFVSPVDWKKRKLEREAKAREDRDIDDNEQASREIAREEEMREKDPYNVTGTWMRVVCFLDYSDLYSFNFSEPLPAADEPRPALDQEEAIRLITMKLRVTKLESAGQGQQPGSIVTHFGGTSRSMHVGWDPNANSGIRGTVSTTPEGEVRWTSFSVFHGEERWRSEGIQVGGPQSARGVWGSWFDKDFDPDGPAGPTAFWKLTDELPPNEPQSFNTATSHYSQPVFENNGMPNDRRSGEQHSHYPGSIGVFGAAATVDGDEDEEEGGKDGAPSGLAAYTHTSLAAGLESSSRDQPIDEQHPYNQVIMTDEGQEQDEVLLEFEEEDEDGDGGGTVTLPASSILEILDAEGSSSEDDEDYDPAQAQPQ